MVVVLEMTMLEVIETNFSTLIVEDIDMLVQGDGIDCDWGVEAR